MRKVLYIAAKSWASDEATLQRLPFTLEALRDDGIEVHLVTVHGAPPPPLERIVRHDVHIPFAKSMRPDRPSLRRMGCHFFLLCKAIHLASRTRYVAIHGLDDCGVLAWIAGQLTRTLFVHEYHPLEQNSVLSCYRRLLGKIGTRLRKWAWRSAQVVISNHPRVIDDLARIGRSGRACIIPDIPGILEDVKTPALNLASARFKHHPEQRLVLCLCTPSELAMPKQLFASLARIVQKEPEILFAIVGTLPDKIENLRDHVEAAALEGNILIIEKLPNIEWAALLSVCEFAILPSPVTLNVMPRVLDCFRVKKALVAVDSRYGRSLLSRQHAVLVGDAADALVRGVVWMLQNPRRVRDLGFRGWEMLKTDNRTPEAFREALHRCYAYVTSESL